MLFHIQKAYHWVPYAPIIIGRQKGREGFRPNPVQQLSLATPCKFKTRLMKSLRELCFLLRIAKQILRATKSPSQHWLPTTALRDPTRHHPNTDAVTVCMVSNVQVIRLILGMVAHAEALSPNHGSKSTLDKQTEKWIWIRISDMDRKLQ